MRTRLARIALVGLVAGALAALVWGFLLSLALGAYPRPPTEEAPLIGALWQCAMLGFLAVGTLVAARRPRHPMGWVLLSLPLLFWGGWAQGTALELARLEARPLPRWMLELDWIEHAVGVPALLGSTLFLLVGFPEGKLSRTGRWIVRVAVPYLLVVLAARLVAPLPLDGSGIPNPHAVPSLDPVVSALAEGGEGFVLVLLVAALDLVRRYRRSRGTERQQFRWVVRSLLFVPLGIVLAQAGEALLDDRLSQLTDLAGIWVSAFGVAAGIGVAVLRYRLYDIDRVVSRTLGYALVTAVLVGIYGGAVIVLGAVARAVTGSASDLVVALSTLLAAAAFRPVRQRVQAVVDRRFNRARYDAERTNEVFAARLRDEVDLSEVRQDLVRTVSTSLSPRGVSIWLPEETSA